MDTAAMAADLVAGLGESVLVGGTHYLAIPDQIEVEHTAGYRLVSVLQFVEADAAAIDKSMPLEWAGKAYRINRIADAIDGLAEVEIGKA